MGGEGGAREHREEVSRDLWVEGHPVAWGKAASSTSGKGTLESWEKEEKEDPRGARAQREWRSRDWGGASRSGGGYFVCELRGEGEPLPGLGGGVLCGPDPVLFL